MKAGKDGALGWLALTVILRESRVRWEMSFPVGFPVCDDLIRLTGV